jgi:hypothetical protein
VCLSDCIGVARWGRGGRKREAFWGGVIGPRCRGVCRPGAAQWPGMPDEMAGKEQTPTSEPVMTGATPAGHAACIIVSEHGPRRCNPASIPWTLFAAGGSAPLSTRSSERAEAREGRGRGRRARRWTHGPQPARAISRAIDGWANERRALDPRGVKGRRWARSRRHRREQQGSKGQGSKGEGSKGSAVVLAAAVAEAAP